MTLLYSLSQELEKSKKLQTREKEIKAQNLTTDELMRKKKELTMGHDEIMLCADTEEPGNNTLTLAVMRSAGTSGEGFHGKVQDISMADLMGETSATAEEPMEANVMKEADETPGEEDQKPNRKVGRGWDRATQIAAKVRGEQSSLLELECLLKTRLEDVEKIKDELSKKSSECNNGVSVELGILCQRRDLVSMVLDKSDDGIQLLQAEIAKIQAASVAAADDDGIKIANSPPCPAFERLQTVKALHDNANRFYEAENASQLHLGKLWGFCLKIAILRTMVPCPTWVGKRSSSKDLRQSSLGQCFLCGRTIAVKSSSLFFVASYQEGDCEEAGSGQKAGC